MLDSTHVSTRAAEMVALLLPHVSAPITADRLLHFLGNVQAKLDKPEDMYGGLYMYNPPGPPSRAAMV